MPHAHAPHARRADLVGAQIFSSDFTGNADMPYDFFMSRYKEAYVQETLAFVDSVRPPTT